MKLSIISLFLVSLLCLQLNGHEFQDWKNLNRLYLEAVDAGDIAAIRDYVSHGAALATKDRAGRAPLHNVISDRKTGLALELINLRAPLETREDSNQDTPLHVASKMGNVDVINALLKAGAQVNPRNRYEATPLFVAASEGHDEAVKILVAAGGDLEAGNDKNQTPIMVARKHKHKKVIQFLEPLYKKGSSGKSWYKKNTHSEHKEAHNGEL